MISTLILIALSLLAPGLGVCAALDSDFRWAPAPGPDAPRALSAAAWSQQVRAGRTAAGDKGSARLGTAASADCDGVPPPTGVRSAGLERRSGGSRSDVHEQSPTWKPPLQ